MQIARRQGTTVAGPGALERDQVARVARAGPGALVPLVAGPVPVARGGGPARALEFTAGPRIARVADAAAIDGLLQRAAWQRVQGRILSLCPPQKKAIVCS